MSGTGETGSVASHDGRDARRIPGAREPGMLTRFGLPDASVPFVAGAMDAATIADREREGGGGPSQRRPRPATRWSEDVVGRTWRAFLATARIRRAPQPVDMDRHVAPAAPGVRDTNPEIRSRLS